MEARLIKIDRNGSKHYEGYCKCSKCDGLGRGNWLPDNGLCYQCGGTGKVFQKWVERTPEYQAKLDERRRKKAELEEAKHQAELPRIRAEWLANHGFNADGQTFIFLGDTFSKKDELKEAGAKFDACIGWHIDHELEGFHFITVKISEIAKETPWGYEIDTSRSEWDEKKRLAWKALGTEKLSEHVGEVGKKLTLKVKYVHTASWETGFKRGYWSNDTQLLHKFVDADGNILVWKTTLYIDAEYGAEMTLTGTVKEHSEYKSECQTVMTRCKLS